MAAITESLLVVPAELVRGSCGIAMDMGGSVFKAIYRTAENLDEVKNPDAEVGHLTLLAVSGERFEEAVEFLASRAVLTVDRSSNLVYTTGVGCSSHRRLLAKKLNVRVESVTEFDCFVRAFGYLSSHLTRSDLLEPFDAVAAEKVMAVVRRCTEVLQNMKTEGLSSMEGLDSNGIDKALTEGLSELKIESPLPLAEAEGDLYPCLLAMCGSGYGFLLVNADGSFRFNDGSASGGRNFLGLGCLLTGAKTYDELIALAMKGNAKGVHVYGEDLFEACTGDSASAGENGETEQENNVYSQMANLEGTLCYAFGKCVGKQLSDFSKEDLAMGLLVKFVTDAIQTISLVSHLHGVGRVFFAGSFFHHKFVKGLATAEFISRNIYMGLSGQKPLKFDFLKPGPQMGAVGALIEHYEKFSKAQDCNNNQIKL